MTLTFGEHISQSYRAFCLFGFADKAPKRSTLQRNIKLVRAETLERVNRALVGYAQEQEIEDGQRLRSDSTVVEAAILEPTDSRLLVDCVRVLTRWLRRARAYVALSFTNHLRRAKRRALAIQHSAKTEQRVPLYRDLVRVAEDTVEAARFSVEKLEQRYPPEAFEQPELHALRAALHHFIELARRCSIRPAGACSRARPCQRRRRSSRSSSRTPTSSARIGATRCTATRCSSPRAPPA